MNYEEYQDAFNVIKDFYDHAWQSLLVFMGLLFTALGILPTIMTTIHNRNVEKKLKKTVQDFQKELNEHSEKLKNLENEYTHKFLMLGKNNNEVMGKILFMQGNVWLREEDVYGITIAFFSFLRALYYYIQADNESNVQKSINMLMNISNATDISLEPLKEYSEIVDYVLKWMNDDVRKYRYADDIFFLKNIFRLDRESEKEL